MPLPLTLAARLRWQAVQPLLPGGSASLLEIGCGQGGFGTRLAERYRYTGVEPDARSCAVASSRIDGRGQVHHGDVSVLDSDEAFDVVCAFEVLEHVEDDRDALARWLARLRPGGLLVMSVPRGAHRFAAGDEAVGHWRRYDAAVLETLLHDSGLQDVETLAYGGLLGYLLEGTRNLLARRAGVTPATSAATRAERSSGSGRFLQPGRAGGAALAVLGWPGIAIDRLVPGHGPGLLARGRKPDEG